VASLALTSGRRTGSTVSTATLAGVAVAAAMAASSIVFSEPAVADLLMAGVIVLLPVLGVTHFGRTAILNLGLWLVIVACGLAACSVSTTMSTAIPHQLVTLFLALGAFILAGYVAADPVPRFRLIMTFYVAGCLAATLAAVIAGRLGAGGKRRRREQGAQQEGVQETTARRVARARAGWVETAHDIPPLLGRERFVVLGFSRVFVGRSLDPWDGAAASARGSTPKRSRRMNSSTAWAGVMPKWSGAPKHFSTVKK